MSRFKKSLTPQSQWTLILLGGLAFIYLGFHWQEFTHPKAKQAAVSSSSVQTLESSRLDIPNLKISVPIVYSSSSKASDVEAELKSGVVHLGGTANPGEVGNSYIVGHSSNYKNSQGEYNEVFFELPNIHVGDKVYIKKGKEILTFVVYETRVVEPTELWVMSQETAGDRILTLQTSYPVGTADRRFIAVARFEP
ncbi:MAG: sortase [Candidatus Doudnabacteria bacterium]|nr:sortase [Candidatus Doudnabacteria bacterium]